MGSIHQQQLLIICESLNMETVPRTKLMGNEKWFAGVIIVKIVYWQIYLGVLRVLNTVTSSCNLCNDSNLSQVFQLVILWCMVVANEISVVLEYNITPLILKEFNTLYSVNLASFSKPMCKTMVSNPHSTPVINHIVPLISTHLYRSLISDTTTCSSAN